jgi:hypothetical protein
MIRMSSGPRIAFLKIALLSLSALLPSCIPFTRSRPPTFTTVLVEVERAGEIQAQLAAGAATRTARSAGYRYSDELIATTILPGGEGLGLDVTNLSDHPIRLFWNRAAFLGTDGSVDPVIRHLGPYPELSPYQSPSVIQPESVVHAAVEPERGRGSLRLYVLVSGGGSWVTVRCEAVEEGEKRSAEVPSVPSGNALLR